MLKVDRISRRYGSRLALKDLSFQAGEHEIIALMGRNGAGKSTLMNILTGYLAPSEGQAFIGGHDVQSEPLAARRLVGYLPETPPLYPDMTVREYLTYCARLKGIAAKAIKAEVSQVIERTGLKEYTNRLSRALSKGYRQRLGMAQALLGSPALLVLDEPGSGLDPLQMVQMRELIVSAAKGCTVLLSSHILSEVTNVCTRALVLEAGQLRYDGPMSTLLEGENALRVVYQGAEGIPDALRTLPGVRRVRELPEEAGALELLGEPGSDLRRAVSQCVTDNGGILLELSPQRGGLESAFLRLLDDGKEAAQ
ncbi:MAG: ABC transporter ATP-binding protein [Clostridiales bacterium]|nr:ABC transporter ATP-binding protein [Clostridiales bacterium]